MANHSPVKTGALLLLTVLCGCNSPAAPPSSPSAQSAGQQTAAPPPAAAKTVLSAEQARQVLAATADAAKNDPQPSFELAMFNLRANQSADAERQLAALWKRFPNFARAPYQLGMLYLAQNNPAAAIPPLRAAAALDKDDSDTQAKAGYALLRAGNEEGARPYAEAAKRLDPQAYEAYMLLAQINDHHGTALQALDDTQKYLERSPNPAPGLFLMGRLYARMKDAPNAEQWLKRALDATPDNPEIWLTLGRVYYENYRSTRASEALQCFQKALSLAPDDAEANFWMGQAQADAGSTDEAIRYFRTALKTTQEPGPVYYNLAQALLKSGQRAEGEKALAAYQGYETYRKGVQTRQTAIDHAPKRRDLRYDLARFCIAQHQYRSALTVLDAAEKQLGKDATLQNLRAEAETGVVEAGEITTTPGGNP